MRNSLINNGRRTFRFRAVDRLAKPFIGIIAFLTVLLAMPLGHTVMIVMENIFGHEYVYMAAFFMGLVGALILVYGSHTLNPARATFAGLFAGLFIWTGWIEFSHVYIANRFHIQPLMEGGEIVTKPEYLIMPASAGFLGYFLIYYLLKTNTGCSFYNFFQRKLKIPGKNTKPEFRDSNLAIVTSSELIIILWTFYLVLLYAYDNSFFGDKHIITYVIAFGSLLWSLILFPRLLRISSLGHAVRYSIPTVIIFWNFIEILGRWNVFHEIWIHPEQYWLEVMLISIIFILLSVYSFFRKIPPKNTI